MSTVASESWSRFLAVSQMVEALSEMNELSVNLTMAFEVPRFVNELVSA